MKTFLIVLTILYGGVMWLTVLNHWLYLFFGTGWEYQGPKRPDRPL